MTFTLQIFRARGSSTVAWTILNGARHLLWQGEASNEQEAISRAAETYRFHTGCLPLNGLSDYSYAIERLGFAA